MMHFQVETYTPADASCMKCCCQTMALQPGTTTKISVGYAPWAVPIGWLHCLPQFAIEQMETCIAPIPGNNLPPAITALDGMARFDTGTNVKLTADMKTKVTDPDGDPVTFKVLPLYAPKYGKLILDPTGPFEYTPMTGFKGEERFFCSATDNKHDPLIYEVLIAVGIDAGTMSPKPTIMIGTPVVDAHHHIISFPVTMSPAAQPCEIWRLTVLQGALDCSCTCFTRTDCFDIKVAKC